LLSNKEQQSHVNHAVNADLIQKFPAALRERIALGHARMLDYQGSAYAALYLDRLQRVLAAESSNAGNAGDTAGDITHEMARWLALWMAFDDILRVADLKSRSSRWLRVQGEVKAKDDDLLQVYDHFKPGVPEFAALLPQRWAQGVLAWDRRRQASGKAAWAMPLKVGTHSVRGMLALRGLASLKALRPYSSRYLQEQALITTWLDSVVAGTLAHPQLGLELALCGRLIKGYGSTNERGKDNLLHIVNHLATSALPAAERAKAVAAARTAALADDAGQALDRTLVQHGAPARAVKEQPIRWMRRPSPSK
jgi:indolepyruvate ferredoxin oxidoreductase beta subunit